MTFLPILAPAINRLNARPGLIEEILTFVMFIFLMLCIYALLMLLRRIGQLKRAPR